MLDKDLAQLYGVETRALNQAVKRNIDRFPEDFMFQLTKEEFEHWKSQFVISNHSIALSDEESRAITMGARKKPYAFTEQGVAMLSSVLRSPTAVAVNIQIMRAFVSMRHLAVSNAEIFQRLSTMEYHQLEMQQHQQETDKRIEEVFRRLDEGNAKPKQGVFYDGQVYDAYTFVSDLIKSAKSRKSVSGSAATTCSNSSSATQNSPNPSRPYSVHTAASSPNMWKSASGLWRNGLASPNLKPCSCCSCCGRTGSSITASKATSPLIVFMQDRLTSDHIYFDPKIYEEWKERARLRMQSMIDYVTDTDTCRKARVTRPIVRTITEQIKTLAAQGLSEKEVLHRLAMTYDEQTVTDAMRKLIDLHGKL